MSMFVVPKRSPGDIAHIYLGPVPLIGSETQGQVKIMRRRTLHRPSCCSATSLQIPRQDLSVLSSYPSGHLGLVVANGVRYIADGVSGRAPLQYTQREEGAETCRDSSVIYASCVYMYETVAAQDCYEY